MGRVAPGPAGKPPKRGGNERGIAGTVVVEFPQAKWQGCDRPPRDGLGEVVQAWQFSVRR